MPEADHVRVSILLAARNEEANILRCLRAIEQLTFPTADLEVIIGNDHSEDQTGPLVEQFIAGKPQYRLVNISTTVAGQRGKANVLAQLARLSKGTYLFFTDADVAVSPGWIESMLRPFQEPRVGIVTGCTQITGNSFWHTFQAMEWLSTQYLLKQLANWRIPVTAMGNNMAVRRAVYEEIGGYENLPFSIVEDYQLFQEILKRGYRFAHLFEPDVLATTLPMPNLRSWLVQRKRWMVGAFQLPWYFLIVLVIQALLLPGLILLAFWNPALAFGIWLLRFLFQSFQVVQVAIRFRRFDFLPYLLPYDLQVSVNWLLSLVYYLLPTRLAWKGRTFDP